jgi:hypothetical protein
MAADGHRRTGLGTVSTRSAAPAAAALALLAAAWLSPRAIPYNMDEFIHYHALACASATQAYTLPVIRDYCHYYDLTLPFTSTPLPLRAYLYIGSIPALPFYPFWKLVGDPVAVRLAGAACFLLCTFMAARLVGVGASEIVTASLVFPVWLATFLVDEGPVGLSALLLLAALHAMRRALRAPPGVASAAWAAACGLALFLGLWTKLVFAWWLPTVLAFTLEEARGRGLSLAELARRRAMALVAAVVFLAAPTALLLASTDVKGHAYAAALWPCGSVPTSSTARSSPPATCCFLPPPSTCCRCCWPSRCSLSVRGRAGGGASLPRGSRWPYSPSHSSQRAATAAGRTTSRFHCFRWCSRSRWRRRLSPGGSGS